MSSGGGKIGHNPDGAPTGPSNQKAGGRPTREIPEEIFDEMYAYALGYRQPPKHSRFQKGQSGNPKGRPKKSKLDDVEGAAPIIDPMLQKLVGKAMARKARVRKPGGEVVEMPAEEALVEKMFEKAAQGNVAAARLLFELNERRRATEAAEAAENYAFWSDYKTRKEVERAVALERGEPAPEVLPDPEDILLLPGHRVRIVGPRNDEEKKEIAQLVLQRDYHKALLGRSIWKWHNRRPRPKTPIPVFLSMITCWAFEEKLPPRLGGALTLPWIKEQMTIGGKKSYNNLMRAAYAAGTPIPGHRFHQDYAVPDSLIQKMMEVKALPSDTLKAVIFMHLLCYPHDYRDMPLLPELGEQLDYWRTEMEAAGFDLPR